MRIDLRSAWHGPYLFVAVDSINLYGLEKNKLPEISSLVLGSAEPMRFAVLRDRHSMTLVGLNSGLASPMKQR